MHWLKSQPKTIWYSALFVVIVVVAGFWHSQMVEAAPTYYINYQGKLTDNTGATVADGTYNMRFWLTQNTSQATTSAVWTESLTSTNRVQVTNGLFSVMLGSTTNDLHTVDFNQPLYLGVEIGGTGASPAWDGEMSPRKILGTVPAAFEAKQFDGLATTSFLRSDQADAIEATENITTLLTITQNGFADIINVFDGSTEVFAIQDGGNTTLGTTSAQARLTIQATGTDDILQLLETGGQSVLTVREDGSVGIGTTTPFAELVVDGDFALTGGLYDNNLTRGTNGQILQTTGAGVQWVATNTLNISAATLDGLDSTAFLRSNTLNATGSITDLTTTNATTTRFSINGDTFTDLTGTGLSNTSGVLTLNATGDWTGTLDGREAVDFLRSDITNASGSITNLVFGTATGTTLILGADYLTDITGTGLSVTGGTLNVGNLTTNEITNGTLTEADFNLNTPTDGYVLQASSTSAGGFVWVATGTLGINGTADDLSDNSITDLSDVDTTGAVGGNILVFNGSSWVDQATTTFLMETELDTEAELETQIGSIDVVTVTTDDISSANLATLLSDETGSGNAVFSVSPTFTGTTNFASLLASGSSTISLLNFDTATGTALVIGADYITDFTGTGLTLSGSALTTTLGTDITAGEIADGDHGAFTYASGVATLDNSTVSSSTLAISNWTNGYVLQASTTAAGGFDWVATSTLGIAGGDAGTLDGLDSTAFLRSDTLNATGSITNLTITNATTTLLSINGDTFSDFTGTGLTVTSGALSATLGTDITAGEIADGDHGAFTYASGVATLDTNSVSDNEIDYTSVTLSDFSDDVGYLTSISGESFLTLTDTPSGYNTGRIYYQNGSAVIDSANFTFDGSTLSVRTSGTADILNLFETGGAEVFTVLESGKVGIGTSSPTALLTVGSSTPGALTAGERYNSAYIAGSLEIDGVLYDTTNNSAGSNGMVMQTTGTGFTWVSTSSLGFSADGGDAATLDTLDSTAFLRADQANATGSITNFAFTTATGTTFAIGGDIINEFAGTGLTVTGNALTATLGTDITAGEIADGDHGAFTYASGVASLDNDVVTPNDVYTTGQTDEYCLTYEATGTTWEWQACSGTFLGLSDTPSSFTANRIFFTNAAGTKVADDAAFTFATSTDTLTIGGMTISDALTTHTVGSTTTVPNNTDFAWTIATSTTGVPLFKIDTTSGFETVQVGSGAGDVYIGGVGSASSLVFEESSTISGQGTNVITLGVVGDTFNVAPGVTFNIATTTSGGIFTVSSSTGQTIATLKQYGSGDILNLFDGATEVFSVVDGGKVGVGTTTPQGLFSVHGEIYLGSTTPSVTANSLYNLGGTLYFNGSAVGAGVSTLAGLTDVDTTNAANGNLLQYNGASWATTSTSSLNIDAVTLDGLDSTAFLRSNTLNATGSITDLTTTNATTTRFSVGGDTFSDLTGTGLQVVAGALTLNATGDWTGTLDGREAVDFLRSDITNASGSITNLVFGTATGTTLVLGADYVTDLTGTGLQVSSGALQMDINGLTEEVGFTSGDFLAFYDTTAGVIRKVDYDQLPGAGGGITSLNGLTGATQTFATGTDTNITLTITSSGSEHTFTPGWTGQLGVTRGGTGLASVAAGDLLYGSGVNTISALTAGTNGNILTLSGGVPAWTSTSTFLMETELDTEAELETQIGSVDVLTVTTDDITSANFATLVSDETGTGNVVFSGSPTFTGTAVFANTGIQVGSSVPFSDAAGTLTLQNVDALDVTTESAIEAAIDTLANLTSWGGFTWSPADAGTDAFFGWDDTAGQYENLTAAEALAIIGGAANDFDANGDVTITQADISDLDHTATAITDNLIINADLNIDVEAVDGDYLQYDSTGDNFTWRDATEVKTDLSLNNVENTALSTWTGSTAITTLGTIGTGVWQGTDVGVAYGGTGLSTFGGNNTVLYTTSADTLASSANFTYDGTDLTVGGDYNITDTTSNLAGLFQNSVPLVTASTSLNNYYFAGATSTSFTSASDHNFAFGERALNSLTSGNNNLAIGKGSLINLTIGSDNVALGVGTLNGVTSGSSNVAIGYASGNSGSGNISMGYQSLLSVTGNDNIGFGEHSMDSLTSGINNVAIGKQAGQYMNTGDDNIAIGYLAGGNTYTGSDNVAIGRGAHYNADGNALVAIGEQTMVNNAATGSIAIGHLAADNTTSADYSIFLGYNIDAFSATDDYQLNIGNLIFGQNVDGTGTTISTGNIGIGTSTPNSKLTVAGDINIDAISSGLSIMGNRVLYSSTTNDSILIGENAGALLEGASTNNIAIGLNALDAATSTVTNNIAIGVNALSALTTGADFNVAIGTNALAAQTNQDWTVAVGYNAGANANARAGVFVGTFSGGNVTSSGADNTFVGYSAGDAVTNGNNNAFFGSNAGGSNVTASFSTYIGAGAGLRGTAAQNTAVGYAALRENQSGSGNAILGYRAAYGGGGAFNTSNNTILGYEAGDSIITGAGNNIFIGYQAADSLTSGASNIIIGYNVEAPSNTADNQLNIGNLIFGNGVDGTGTTISTGNIGIGTSTPNKRLQVFDTVSDDQFRISYDATRYADFQVDSVGDLIIDAQGADVRLNDENLWVCSGGSCPTGTPSGNGNLIVETALGIGTSSPRAQVEIWDDLYVAAGNAQSAGVATSTFQGDVLIMGKLDVGTVDPVYEVGDTKYATYGMSSIGIKEQITQNIVMDNFNEETGYYEAALRWSEVEKDTGFWLFYQITDFGAAWEYLSVSLTPGFDGRVFYEKDVENNALIIKSTKPGEVATEMVANRYDWEEWSMIRPDQDTAPVHHRVEEKPNSSHITPHTTQ